MKHCIDCNRWAKQYTDCCGALGTCNLISCQGNQVIYRGNKLHLTPAKTREGYGCVYFEKKPKGPFIVLKSSGFDVWNIFIAMPHEEIRILQGTKVRMDEIAALLNEQWAIAKGARRE